MDKLLSRDALAQGIVAHLQPGDLFLWDSRATHGATPGNLTAATSGAGGGAELFRAAAYVCMAPTSRASERVLQQREEMLLAHQGTGAFCAAYNNNAAGGRPRDSGSAFQPVLQDMDQLSPSQWELVIGKARAAARFTTNATDKAEAAAMRVGGGAAADIAVPSVLDAVASVKIDADAIQKYVLIKATTESESISTSTYVVRGSEAAKYHRNAAQETLVELENLGVRYEVLGGGRIKHDTATRTIEIFGYSNGFPWVGEPRHDLSAEAVRAAFPGFEVTTSDAGY
jgi:phosphohistidine phosphatase